MEITAPTSSAFTGVRKRLLTEDSHAEAGSAPSRAKENASRLPAPWIDVPHEKKAKMMRRSRKSCIPLESWPRIAGTPPPSKTALIGSCFGIASRSAAVSTKDEIPPQIRAHRIADGILRPASFVSSAMSPADSKP